MKNLVFLLYITNNVVIYVSKPIIKYLIHQVCSYKY